MEDGLILQVKNLSLKYGDDNVGKNLKFSLYRGEVLGIVGESGSGKSTLLKAIIDPMRFGITCTGGTIQYKGVNVQDMSTIQRLRLKGVEIGLVTQNPFGAFNPIRSFYKQFYETLKSHDRWFGDETVTKILEMFRLLDLTDGERILNSCPYEMSGGMNQRISIALAIVLKPTVLLLDEPTSALDVTLQAQVVKQISLLREISEITMILVSHNLSVIAELSDKVAVMYEGEIIEFGKTREVLLHPNNSYTKKLLKSIPKIRFTKGET